MLGLHQTKGNKMLYIITLTNGDRIRVNTREEWQDPIGYLRPSDRSRVMDVETLGVFA
jgi:hypothetical protein